MIVFWKGFGPISAALPVVGLILAEVISSMTTPDGNVWWRPALVLFISAAVSLIVYLWLLKTCDAPIRKADPFLFCHHLMFIPMGLHPLIFFLIGLFQWYSFAPHK